MYPQTKPAFRFLAASFSFSTIVRVALALGLAATAYGCSAQSSSSEIAATPTSVGTRHNVVLASWYGPGFEGRTTSSGERFHSNGYTAASRTLPLGSHIRVTNLSTGRSVVVRVNDRGPFVKGRSLDLSHAAARKIGLDRRGVEAVRVTRLDGKWGEVGADGQDDDVSPRRSHRYHEPDPYTRTSPVTPIAATTESASMVPHPVGSWLMGLFR